jgi:DNA-binding transcriptional ArsR family regulator
MARKSVRYNELFRTVNKLNPKQKSGKDFVSKPTFDDHLKHLINCKLVVAKREGKQKVTYSLNKDAMSVLSENVDSEDIEDWLKRMPLLEVINPKEHYAKLTEKALDQEVSRDLGEVLETNLLELKSYVNYDLKIDEQQNDAEFWKFVGNPLYRILEKSIADNCRESVEYREKFFEKVEFLLKERFLLKIVNDKSEA